jgi:medium-chain acyl-[acyl-carrier-protein] hydrolase
MSGHHAAPRRLFCFHNAGGSAADFARWPSLVSPRYEVIAVQLPGRGSRLREPPLSDVHTIADAIALAIAPALDRDYVVLGHSLGGLVAYEVLKRLQQRSLRMPLRFVTGARAAPSLTTGERTHEYPRDAFIQSLAQYGALPESVVRDQELMDFFLPMLRADVAVYETYRYEPGEPLDCPVLSLVGSEDTVVTLERARGWQGETSLTWECDVVQGNHFFHKTHPDTTAARALRGL